MFSEVNSAMLWKFGWDEWMFLFSFCTPHDNALFDLGTGEIPRLVLHTIQDMGWELLRREKSTMKLGYSDVYSSRGAHRE